MGTAASVGGALMQAKAQKDAVRSMMAAQDRAALETAPYSGSLVSAGTKYSATVINCKGCGAPHLQGHFCEYCGGGRPSVPSVKRSHPK